MSKRGRNRANEPTNPIPDLLGVLRRGGKLPPETTDPLVRIAALPAASREAALIAEGLVAEEDIAQAVAEDTGLPYCAINPAELPPEVVTGALPAPFARRHTICALSRDEGVLTVAMANPYAQDAIRDLERYLGIRVRVVVATRSDIEGINTSLYNLRTSLEAAETQLWDEHGETSAAASGTKEFASGAEAGDDLEPTTRPVVSALDSILRQAFEQRASDIHMEPKRDLAVVRFRVDGVLRTMHRFPRIVHQAVVSRVKMLSGLDIAEKRRPQDGRMKRVEPGKEIELRVSTLPTVFGEKAVLRVFDPTALVASLEQLRLASDEETRLRALLDRREGLVLVTGPTGSGKTTTLYSVLRQVATPDVNVITIEDPVELIHSRLSQVQVHLKIGLTFAAAIRSVLRQDPDIVMVGEIRDQDTAEMAVQAALTGHLVLSTLHTNDAPGALTRLSDLGVPRFLIATTLIGVVAQRLVRTVCSRCSRWKHLSAAEAEVIAAPGLRGRRVREGEGCARCGDTGYRGRRAIFEILSLGSDAVAAILAGQSAEQLSAMARRSGFRSLRQNALRAMLAGETTLAEVVRVTGAGPDPGGGSVPERPPEEQEKGWQPVEHEDDVRERGGAAPDRDPGQEAGARERDLPDPTDRVDEPDADEVEEEMHGGDFEAEVGVGTGNGQRSQEGGHGGPHVGSERHRECVVEGEQTGAGERDQHRGRDRARLSEDRDERADAHREQRRTTQDPPDGVLRAGSGEALEGPHEEPERQHEDDSGPHGEDGGSLGLGPREPGGDSSEDMRDPLDQALERALVVHASPDEAAEPAGDHAGGSGEESGRDLDRQQDRNRPQIEQVVAGGDGEGPPELGSIAEMTEGSERVRDRRPEVRSHDHGNRAGEGQRGVGRRHQGDDERGRDRGTLDQRRGQHSHDQTDEGVGRGLEEPVEKARSEPLEPVAEAGDGPEEHDEQDREEKNPPDHAVSASAGHSQQVEETNAKRSPGAAGFRFVIED